MVISVFFETIQLHNHFTKKQNFCYNVSSTKLDCCGRPRHSPDGRPTPLHGLEMYDIQVHV
jgi:hypothetical protein